ncbi:MAG: NAD-binding protein [Armatimonadetes bacterium]|nr:NAD-binding protein [Armatimonadota bacterium]
MIRDSATPTQKLYTPGGPAWRNILIRLGIVLLLMGFVCLVLWTKRDGMADERGSPVGMLDIIYFTVVTVTTVGYGDIVPVSPDARAFVTFGVAPIRVVIWLIFLSAAYQLFVRQQTEAFRLGILRRKLKDHTIICGFGVKGRSAAQQLLDRGVPQDQIIAIDPKESAVAAGVEQGFRVLRGDAASQDLLLDAGVKSAADVIVTPDEDGKCVLICLTIKDLNSNVRVVASAREEENVRLIYRSGADAVIAPSVDGGRLLAAATEAPVSTTFIEEFIHHGRGMDVIERVVEPGEEGITVADLKDLKGAIILGLKTGTERLDFSQLSGRRLRSGDVVVALKLEENKETS